MSFCVLRPVGSNMLDLSQGSIEPSADPSMDLASQFSALDDAPSKHKRKRGDTAQGKDAQVKLGDHTEDRCPSADCNGTKKGSMAKSECWMKILSRTS